MNAKDYLLLAAGVGAVYLLYLATRTARNAAGAVVDTVYDMGHAINPVNQDNIFYSGVNAVGGKLTGQGDDFTLGGWIYDATH